MSESRTTRWQIVLLAAVALAVTALVLLIRDAQRAPGASTPAQVQSMPGQPVVSPQEAFVRRAYELTDTLHSIAEAYVRGSAANPDSAAHLPRQTRYDATIRAAIDDLNLDRGIVPDHEFEAVLSLVIGYLDARDLDAPGFGDDPGSNVGFNPGSEAGWEAATDAAARAEDFLARMDSEREDLESIFGPYFVTIR